MTMEIVQTIPKWIWHHEGCWEGCTSFQDWACRFLNGKKNPQICCTWIKKDGLSEFSPWGQYEFPFRLDWDYKSESEIDSPLFICISLLLLLTGNALHFHCLFFALGMVGYQLNHRKYSLR